MRLTPSAERCDPDRLIADALAGTLAWPPPDVFLAWLLRLPLDVDPALAAGVLLRAHADAPNDAPLIALLREAEQCQGQTPPTRRRRCH